jgi:homoserine dehydrogenase
MTEGGEAKRTVNIGLIGSGTVGTGFIKILQKNADLIEAKAGARLRLAWVCDRVRRPLPTGRHKPRFTTRWEDVTSDPSVDIVVELIGGYEPARTIVLAALKAGKHVTTANKALLAKYWGEVVDAAVKSQAILYFEASVGGGIPVIQGLNEGLAANRIQKVYGILNGTTNYILGRMTGEGLDFKTALKGAQEAGFAEADPTFDIEGIDAAHKLAILASLASETWIRLEDVSREGISNLDVWDLRFAQERLGLVTKLLGIVELDGRRFSARVHPALIPASHPFANVRREYNAIFIHGDAAGDVMFYGKGAGQMPAASAVASDVVYLARQVAGGTAGIIPYVTYHSKDRLQAIPMREASCRHYLRIDSYDRPGVLSRIAGELGRHEVSIESVHQEADPGDRRSVPIVIVTHRAREGAVQDAIREIGRQPYVRRRPAHLRIEELP